jgi:hypothetical protein
MKYAVEMASDGIYYFYLFTAIGFAPGGSSPTLVQTKTIEQHYTVVHYNKT